MKRTSKLSSPSWWLRALPAASRGARGAYLLPAAMDSIAFAAPTRVGDIMYIEAQATAIFGSSVEVMISVWAETPEVGGLFACGDAYATVVSSESGAGAYNSSPDEHSTGNRQTRTNPQSLPLAPPQ